jgi:cobalt/nickel transport system permease protein
VLLMLLALIGSLEFSELGRALGGLGAPERLVQLLLFTVRAIDLIGREYRTLRSAMRVRAFRMRTSPHVWRSMGYLFGMLLVRSLDRSERILGAMRCRCFAGRFPSLAEPRPLAPGDLAFALLAALACAILLVAEWWG